MLNLNTRTLTPTRLFWAIALAALLIFVPLGMIVHENRQDTTPQTENVLRPSTPYQNTGTQTCDGACLYGLEPVEGPPCNYVEEPQSMIIEVLEGGSVWQCAALALRYTDEELVEMVDSLQAWLDAKAPNDRTPDVDINVVPPGWTFDVGYDGRAQPLEAY